MRIEPLTLAGGKTGLMVTSTDISELKRHEEHLRTVMRELNHRSKNLLTIVMSLTRQTARSFKVPKAFLARLQERMAALASAHDELARQDWKGADLKSVIEGQLKYQLESFPDRITIAGPACQLPSEGAQYVGMAIHELGSNAVKYGALSAETGRVHVVWGKGPSGDAPLVIEWTEVGGPALDPPTQFGFGSTILRTLTPKALDGKATLDFLPTGVRWTLTAPLSLSGS
jgi:two-component sensor histidine kinase